MNSYLLDTSLIINFLIREIKEDIKLVKSIDGNLTSSYICLAELYEGVYRTKNKKYEEGIILSFFSDLNNIFGIDQAVAQKFGEIRAKLKSEGNIIADMDLVIAATCIAYNQILITHNQRHFSRIPDLKIY